MSFETDLSHKRLVSQREEKQVQFYMLCWTVSSSKCRKLLFSSCYAVLYIVYMHILCFLQKPPYPPLSHCAPVWKMSHCQQKSICCKCLSRLVPPSFRGKWSSLHADFVFVLLSGECPVTTLWRLTTFRGSRAGRCMYFRVLDLWDWKKARLWAVPDTVFLNTGYQVHF